MGAARPARRRDRNHEDLMMTAQASSYVSHRRLNERLAILATYGATPAGGVNRQALSREDADAQRRMMQWGAEIGLEASRDPAGNFFLRLKGADPDAPPVLSGSHLDSQPTGGRYDGVYGVLAALEAVAAIVESGVRPQRSIEVVAWMNEEGSRFAPGMAGSAAYAGARTLADVLSCRDADGVTVKAALAQMREWLPDLPERPLGQPTGAYVEAHIEQGPVLEREGRSIGVVTGIQGKRTFQVALQGEAAHAGTSTRAERKDALLAAVNCIDALRAHMSDAEDIVKFTVGRLTVEPNAPSVVPARVVFSIDLRHPDSAVLRRLGDAVEPIVRRRAGPCVLEVTELSTAMSLEFDPRIRSMISQAAEALGISCRDIPSAAGHDARYLNDVCPSGMIFVPCRAGITHNEAEFAHPGHLTEGARVLADVLAGLAAQA